MEKYKIAEENLKNFLEENKHIFDTKERLEITLKNERLIYLKNKESIKPPFPIKKWINLSFFSEISTITESDIEDYKEDFEESGDELDEKLYKELKVLIGWNIDYKSNCDNVINDSDYYDCSITFTSPSGNSYSCTQRTCLAMGEFNNMILK